MTAAVCGTLIGFLSLVLVQRSVGERIGQRVAWVLVVLILAMTSFGIYLGRFERLNSWDAVTRPLQVLAIALDPVRSPLAHVRTLAVTLLYAGFILLGYLAVVAMLHACRQLLPAPPTRER